MANAAPSWFERPLTVHDLDELPDEDGTRYEVIDGELYRSPFPFVPHQRAITALLGILFRYLEENPIGEVFTSNIKVVLSEATGVGPDLVYLANAHMDQLRKDGIHGAPDLCVEVTSSKPGLDRIIKHRKYAEARVPHYWILDPDARTLEAFELAGDRYTLVAMVKGTEAFTPKLFPGLEIRLARLFR